MSVNQAVKKNISGMQVIKTLEVMLEGNYTMSELIQKLNENEKEPIFNNSVVSKYINTCRYCGIEIPKIHNKYFVTKLPFGLNLQTRDIELLEALQNTAKEKLNDKLETLFTNFIKRLNQYSNKDIIRVEKKNIQLVYEKFNNAKLEKRKILLMFKTKALLECIPLEIIQHNGKIALKVLDNNKERFIGLDRISGLEILEKISKPKEKYDQEVIFKIKGNLALKYTLREHEMEIGRRLPEYITISNIGEDKDELLARLLRYDKLCEIISPQEYRNEFKAMLKNMLSNYGE